MPAVAVICCNPDLEDFASRLRSSGKHGKQIVAAVMRRLLVLAYGVLKSERPFDPKIGVGDVMAIIPVPTSSSLGLDV